MERRKVDAAVIRRAVERSARESARLERRDVPEGFVRSPRAEQFLRDRRTAAE